jgi:hypothetical protein
MKIAGIILLVLGLLGLFVFGAQALSDSESFSFLGLDIAVSSANWTPVILSGLVMIVGIVLVAARKK